MFENLDSRASFLLGLAAASTIKYTLAWWMREHRKQHFELVGTVKELVCYPVKSFKGIYVQEAECTPAGLKVNGVYDRHWMITMPDGKLVSQRQVPKMALLSVTITEDSIVLNAPGMQPFSLAKEILTQNNVMQCRVHDGKVEGVYCGDPVSKWASDALGIDSLCVVFYSHNLKKRYCAKELQPWETRVATTDWSAFADWCPYLFLTVSSLEELNKHLTRPVTMNSFRPNIIIDGTDPFDEDNWEEILIGDKVQMRCLSACTRCSMTTIDADAGAFSDDGEPLRTLKRIRCIPPYSKRNACAFGVNTAADVFGVIRVGDPVYAIRKN